MGRKPKGARGREGYNRFVRIITVEGIMRLVGVCTGRPGCDGGWGREYTSVEVLWTYIQCRVQGAKVNIIITIDSNSIGGLPNSVLPHNDGGKFFE